MKSRHRSAAPLRKPTPKRCGRSWRVGQVGFTLVETLISLIVLTAISATFLLVIMMLDRGTQHGMAKSAIVNTGRSGLELVIRRLRNEMVQFNTVAGTDLGINFSLDDASGDRLVSDAILVYTDRDHTGLIYASTDGSGAPAFAGLDDFNNTGSADVLGIGLLIQDDDGDGAQDFIDNDDNGAADDLDGDGVSDLLWKLVAARFDGIDDVSSANLWRAGDVLARNLIRRRIDPQGNFTSPNIDNFQFLAKGATALLSDTNGDGVLSETEMGNLDTPDGKINTADEVAMVDSVLINLHVVHTGSRGLVMTGDLSIQVTPRQIELFRLNGIIGLVDAEDATQID